MRTEDGAGWAALRVVLGRCPLRVPVEPLAEGTRVAPGLVAERAGLEPETLRYERAVRHLVREGALVWEERLGGVAGVDLYRITRRGLEMLRAS